MPVKKLYKRGKVHPSSPSPSIDHLALLPYAILPLIAALSDEDKRVLAYLISWSNKEDYGDFGGKNDNNNNINSGLHPFNCDCFGCYTRFWARWNSSPNRQLIHDIIEAYEEELAKKKKIKDGKMKRSQRKKKNISRICDEPRDDISVKEEKVDEESVDLRGNVEVSGEDGQVETEKGTFRRLLSLIGENFSGLWNMG
ncbi:uncharacterized protein LOC21393153 [Morus notabilis]|nr:uncharacterized protein LOC21393153 [Morus notabilis]